MSASHRSPVVRVAVALHDAGRKREALAELDRALARHPRDAQPLGAREELSR
jgi:hypothetical protein